MIDQTAAHPHTKMSGHLLRQPGVGVAGEQHHAGLVSLVHPVLLVAQLLLLSVSTSLEIQSVSYLVELKQSISHPLPCGHFWSYSVLCQLRVAAWRFYFYF